MPENEKPRLSAELLHRLLGEHVEKAGQTLRRKEQLDVTSARSFSTLVFVGLFLLVLLGYFIPIAPIVDFMSVRISLLGCSWSFH